MSAPLGNTFWQARSSHGRSPLFATPDDLWSACTGYFEWVDANPLKETKAFSFQGDVTMAELPKMRAMTISGLCIFLDISPRTWAAYKAREDFVPITERVEQIIRTQKFEGACADLLNANIIARDLGLAEKNENQHSGPNGGPMEVITRVELVGAEFPPDHPKFREASSPDASPSIGQRR